MNETKTQRISRALCLSKRFLSSNGYNLQDKEILSIIPVNWNGNEFTLSKILKGWVVGAKQEVINRARAAALRKQRQQQAVVFAQQYLSKQCFNLSVEQIFQIVPQNWNGNNQVLVQTLERWIQTIGQ